MILVINTAFLQADLALIGKKTFTKTIDAQCKHSENVLKVVDQLCEEANIDILDVDTVAVVTGPGSFTGLRIGVAVAKALGCVKKDMKFVSLSSLELMAYIICRRNMAKENFVCAMNALSDNFFVCEFDKNGIKIGEERMIDKATYQSIKQPKFAFLGDLQEKNTISLDCLELVDFALWCVQQKKFVSEKELLPKYIRLSQAEDNLKKSKKNF